MPGMMRNLARAPRATSVTGLQIRDLYLDAPKSSRRLLDIDKLDIPAGAFVAVIGASGAGKSSLLFVLAGLTPPSTGRVSWNDTDLATLSGGARASFRRRHCGVVFQDALLVDELSALSNAAMPADWMPRDTRTHIEARCRERLTWLGIDPDDNKPVTNCSGGERQRIAMARALACNPPLLFADEPTASLDRQAADRLIGILRDLGETLSTADGAEPVARTRIVVSHDRALIDAADVVVELVDGRIADASGA